MHVEYAKHNLLSKCDCAGVYSTDTITNMGDILIVSLISYLQFIIIAIYYIIYIAISSFVSHNVNHETSVISPMIVSDILDTLTPSFQGTPAGNSLDDSLSSYKSWHSETNENIDTNGNITSDKIGEKLKELRLINKNRVIIGHLNINSVRNKFEELKMFTAGNLDILLIS